VTARLPRHPPSTTPPRPRDAVTFGRGRPAALFGIKAVGSFLPGLTRKAFEKYGFSTASLLTDWPTIAGKELAAYAAPERLKWPRGTDQGPGETDEAEAGRRGATLVLRVDGGRSLDVQHNARQIIERINAYFGYAAIKELRIVQAPLPQAHASVPPATRSTGEPLTHEVAHIADPRLREALARLGAGVRSGR
jgi:hypothetical protein